MRRLFIGLLFLAACRQEQVTTVTTDTREPIAIMYSGVSELPVYAKPDDKSKVLTKYLSGESVSVLAKNGDWSEVRTVDGSGWVHTADLTTAEAAKSEEANPKPKFRVAPSPVSAPSAHGVIYLEADVNTEGEVTHVDVISNETKDNGLLQRNIAALMAAKFYPIVQKGQRKAFKYDFRIDY
ncbi:MAG TPA: SH3 domain-containing protein [Thermoanaerobaculia bacterium]|nr:SH3 domain-containing protein [Thermoanaerobaculia bacterium]